MNVTSVGKLRLCQSKLATKGHHSFTEMPVYWASAYARHNGLILVPVSHGSAAVVTIVAAWCLKIDMSTVEFAISERGL